MPNWVRNKVHFYGNEDKIKEIKELIATDNTYFDFNKIIPMPKELDISAGSDEKLSMECAKARRNGLTTCKSYEAIRYNNKPFDEWADLGEKYLSNLEKYGATTWYDWCCANWGTKWNACDAKWIDENCIAFDTAWSAPDGIYRALAEMFPDVSGEVSYADEDIGNNCGMFSWEDGQCQETPFDDFEFACDVWGYDPDEMREDMEMA